MHSAIEALARKVRALEESPDLENRQYLLRLRFLKRELDTYQDRLQQLSQSLVRLDKGRQSSDESEETAGEGIAAFIGHSQEADALREKMRQKMREKLGLAVEEVEKSEEVPPEPEPGPPPVVPEPEEIQPEVEQLEEPPEVVEEEAVVAEDVLEAPPEPVPEPVPTPTIEDLVEPVSASKPVMDNLQGLLEEGNRGDAELEMEAEEERVLEESFENQEYSSAAHFPEEPQGHEPMEEISHPEFEEEQEEEPEGKPAEPSAATAPLDGPDSSRLTRQLFQTMPLSVLIEEPIIPEVDVPTQPLRLDALSLGAIFKFVNVLSDEGSMGMERLINQFLESAAGDQIGAGRALRAAVLTDDDPQAVYEALKYLVSSGLNPAILLELTAMAMMDQDRFEEAITILEEALGVPEAPTWRTHYLLGDLFLQHGALALSRHHLKEAIHQAPREGLFRVLIGYKLKELNEKAGIEPDQEDSDSGGEV